MYKIEINIAEWDFGSDTVVVETDDFDKIAIIQEFIEFQQVYGWCVDYDAIEFDEEVSEDEVDEDETDEDEEYEEYEIGENVEDEDGLVWKRVA